MTEAVSHLSIFCLLRVLRILLIWRVLVFPVEVVESLLYTTTAKDLVMFFLYPAPYIYPQQTLKTGTEKQTSA